MSEQTRLRGVVYGQCHHCGGRRGLLATVIVGSLRLREHFLRIDCKLQEARRV